ncbi:MAG: lysylphosphatidylglycerol synthase transmembrane domain-containing protein [Candidatus Delongbacteria bacterium]|nr:lysylphosphatidylglycerol synthase transmembrane domain-containing protein [Candidatus Delongbacteria bacterium]
MNNKKNILKAIIALILIGFLFGYLVDFGKFIETLRSIKISYLLIGIFFLISSVFISAFRWKYLLSIRNAKMNYFTAVKEYLIGMFFNNFLPSSVGGDVSRMIGATKATGKKEIAVSSVIVERIIGLVALLILGVVGIIYLDILQDTLFLYLALTLLAFVIGMFLILINQTTNLKFTLFLEKIFKKKFTFLADFRDYSNLSYKLFYVLLISFVFRIVEGLFVYFIVLSIGIELSYLHAIVFFATIGIIKMIPIAPNGLGLSAVSWVYLLEFMSISAEMSASLDFLIITTSLLVSSSGGILWMLNGKKEKNKKRA